MTRYESANYPVRSGKCHQWPFKDVTSRRVIGQKYASNIDTQLVDTFTDSAADLLREQGPLDPAVWTIDKPPDHLQQPLLLLLGPPCLQLGEEPAGGWHGISSRPEGDSASQLQIKQTGHLLPSINIRRFHRLWRACSLAEGLRHGLYVMLEIVLL